MERLIRLALLAWVLFSSILCAQEKDFREYRFFINPGHGGYDSDDRHIETTKFWESESNLEKGLYLKELLEDRKAKVFISRNTNTSEDDLDFAVIDEMANAANVDFFLSIHSNGGSGLINFPLVLYRGSDRQPVYPGAKDFAETLWRMLYENGRSWTRSIPNVRGDLSFYSDWGKLGLAALRTLAVPGVLSEGSFHDYIPESWRMRNIDYLHLEAWGMFQSFKRFYNIRPSNEGVVAGIVRSAEKKSGWNVSNGSNDKLKPMEGVVVRLLPGNKTYRTDSLKNGFFSFERIPKGSYQLVASDKDGNTSDTLSVFVEGDKASMSELFIRKH